MFIYKSIKSGDNKKIKILGVTVYKRCLSHKKHTIFYDYQYLKGIWRVLDNEREKRYYFLGLRICKIHKKLTAEKVYNIVEQVVNDKLMNKLDEIYYDMYVLSQVATLHKAYLPYKRCLEGKEVVLVATGPSAQSYVSPIPNAVHVAVNSAIRYDWIDFDYVFMNDGLENNPTLNDEVDHYKKGKCKKFYGIHSPRRLAINRNNGMAIDRISQKNFYAADATPYVLEDAGKKRWAVNLECEPFGDIGGTSFSALQWICYTHPKKIYLVGCDAGTSFSPTAKKNIDYNHQIKMWQSFKEFVVRVYPDIEVVSINPVNLKGMFEDIHTTNDQEVVSC